MKLKLLFYIGVAIVAGMNIFAIVSYMNIYRGDPHSHGRFTSIMKKAVENKDISVCATLPTNFLYLPFPDYAPTEIESANFVAECVENYFNETLDPKACERLGELTSSNLCYEKIAMAKNDTAYCDKITMTTPRNYWYHDNPGPYDPPHTVALCKAKTLKSTSPCKEFNSEKDVPFRNSCTVYAARLNDDYKTCYQSERDTLDPTDTARYPLAAKYCISEFAIEARRPELCSILDKDFGDEADKTRGDCLEWSQFKESA